VLSDDTQHLLLCIQYGVRSSVISVSVCLPVCLFVCLSTCPNFTKFSVHVTCGRSSILFWWQCTSGLVEDVMFSNNSELAESEMIRMCGGTGGKVSRLWLHLVDDILFFGASIQSLWCSTESLRMSLTLSVSGILYCACDWLLWIVKPVVELQRSATVTAAHRQYSVQALMLLGEVTVTLLDVVYRSEEKERVIPLLSNILYNVFPYLKNHRSEVTIRVLSQWCDCALCCMNTWFYAVVERCFWSSETIIGHFLTSLVHCLLELFTVWPPIRATGL